MLRRIYALAFFLRKKSCINFDVRSHNFPDPCFRISKRGNSRTADCLATTGLTRKGRSTHLHLHHTHFLGEKGEGTIERF